MKYKDGNFRITYPSNFWDDISIPFWSMPENTEHPTQKPEGLYERMILASSNEGDTILDNCMGSGSTGVACMNTGRKFIGIEKEEKYFKIAEERIKEASNNLNKFMG